MLGRRSPQLSLSDTDEWWQRIPPTSRWAQVRQWSLAHWSDARFAAWYAAAFDNRVKFALGVSRTPEILCDHSTLCKFRAQALAADAGRTLLRETLEEASGAGLLGDEAESVDSVRVAGAAALQGTLLLIARAIRQVLVEAEETGLTPCKR